MGCLVINYTKRDAALCFIKKINMKLTKFYLIILFVYLFCFFTFYPFSFLFLSLFSMHMNVHENII